MFATLINQNKFKMKRRLFAFAVMALITVAGMAQTEKGRYMVSGASDLSILFGKTTEKYDGVKGEDYSTTNFSLTPMASYFVIDNLAIGAAIGVDYSKNDDYDATSLFFGPMARYYFNGETIRPFAQGLIGIGTQKLGEAKYSQFNFHLNGGFSYFINEYIAFDASLGYYHTGLTNRDDTKYKINSNRFGVEVGISVLF